MTREIFMIILQLSNGANIFAAHSHHELQLSTPFTNRPAFQDMYEFSQLLVTFAIQKRRVHRVHIRDAFQAIAQGEFTSA